jgi:hypothetical protein
MIIKLNITGMPSTRLKLTSKLFTQLHVERKTDKFGRRVSTSWTTGNTEVTLERYHSNKNSKDVDGVIYVGRSFQQYMDKFDADLGLRLATVRAFNKFFSLNGLNDDAAKKLADAAAEVVMANKDKKSAVIGTAAPAKKVKTVAKTAAAKKRGRPAKADKSVASTAQASAAPKKRGRPRKQPV